MAARTTLLAAALLVAGAVVMAPWGDFTVPNAVPPFLLGAGLMAAGFGAGLWAPPPSWTWLFAVAVAARAPLFWMHPGDDVWRYLWEGMLQWRGVNPYAHPPGAEALAAFRTPWWAWINNQDASSLYPPLAQIGFRLLAFPAPSVAAIRISVFASDLLVLAMLARAFGPARAAVYGWNPLVIYCFTGGAHYDAWFVCAMTASWLAWDRPDGRGRPAALLLGGAAFALKFLTAPLLGFMLWRTWRERGGKAALAGAALAALPFLAGLALLPAPWEWRFPSEFALHARSADLAPRVLEEIWAPTQRMNWLFLIPLAAGHLWLLWRERRVARYAEASLMVVYLFSPMVHAWYFTWAMPLAVATGNWAWRFGAASVFAYFLLQHRVHTEGGPWRLHGWELALLWGPMLAGWFLSRGRDRGPA